MRRPIALAFLLAVFCLSCNTTSDQPASNMTAAREAKKEIQDLRGAIKKVEPFFKPMGKPDQYDWLGTYKEPGQTFEEYLDSDPTEPTRERQTIYVLPLGKFTPEQTKIIDIAARYLAEFYDLPVEKIAQRALTATGENIRQNQDVKTRQVKTGYILNDILLPIVPQDAAAVIAFTNHDLFPDETMNFVFGQASLENRVGVWSLSPSQLQSRLRHVPSPHFEDCGARDGTYVLDASLYEVRMRDERCQSSRRDRPAPHRRLPGVHGKDLLDLGYRSCRPL